MTVRWEGSGGPAVRAYRRATDRLRMAEQADRAGILQAMALTEEPAALRALDLAGAAGWTPLWSAGRRSVFHTRLSGAGGTVVAVAFGELAGRSVLATGGADGTVRLWDPRRGEIVATLTGHSGEVRVLAFGTVEGRSVLAGAGADGTVRLWDPEPLRVLRPARGRVVDVAFAAGAVAVASEDGREGHVGAWDAGTGEHRFSVDFYRDVVDATGGLATVSTMDGELLATFNDDGDEVLLLDPVTGAQVRSLEWEPGRSRLEGATLVPPLVVSRHDGRVLLGATAISEIDQQEPNTAAMAVWWDVRTGEVYAEHGLSMNEAVLAAGGGRFVTATARYRGHRSEPPVAPDLGVAEVGGEWAAALLGHAGHVHAAAVGTVGSAPVIATAGADGAVLLWGAAEARLARLGPGSGLAVVADPDRPLLVAGGSGPSVTLLDPASGAVLGDLRCHAGGHRCPDLISEAGWYVRRDHCCSAVAAAVVDGRWLVATRGDAQGLLLWDPATHEVVRELAEPPGDHVSFAEVDGRTVLVTAGPTPRLCDPATGERIAELPPEMYDPVSVAVGSVRGRTVLAVAGTASRGYVFTVDLFDPLTGERLRRLPIQGPVARRHPPGTAGNARVALAADLVAVAEGDVVSLWDPGSGERLSTVPADGPVTVVGLPEVHGRTLLVTGSARGTVRLWTTGTSPRPVATLATFARPVRAVAVATLAGHPHVFCQAGTGRLTACRLDAPVGE